MCVLIFWTALRGNQNSSVVLSQVMNHGFCSTTPRQNAKVGSGTLQTLPFPRKPEWANPKANRLSFVFLWQSGSSTRNLCHQDSQSNFLWEVLGRLRKRVAHVQPCIACTWKLHHDNAPCHMAVSINEFLTEKAFLWFLSLPIRRISIPVTYFFPWLKNHLKGRHFVTLDNILKSITDELKGIPAEAFQHCYEQWKQRCVAAQGNYFEGDSLDL